MASRIGVYPYPFWYLSWREFDLMIQAHELNEEDEWRRTREIIAMIHNVNMSKRSQMKEGSHFISLPSDIKKKTPKVNSTLQGFKESCKRLGIPWNPVKAD